MQRRLNLSSVSIPRKHENFFLGGYCQGSPIPFTQFFSHLERQCGSEALFNISFGLISHTF